MDRAKNIFSGETLESIRSERMRYIFSWDFSFISGVHEPREIQRKILRDTIRDVKSWKLQGRWDIAPAWGKTYMSLSLMAHIVKNGGRVLYLTPWNTELNNAMDSHLLKYKLWENNFIKFENKSDISSINNPRYKEFYDWIPYHYTTIQMMTYDDRFRMIPADYYDLIVYDESQAFLWDIHGSTIPYFKGVWLFMSAAPFTKTKHLGSIIPHRYGEVSSEYLIAEHSYPKPELINCHVHEWNLWKVLIDDSWEDFDFENNQEQRNLLNISERFRISEAIYEEIIVSGDRKGLDFMPTVDDAEIFVKYVVPNNPILNGKVDFVAGRRGKNKNHEIEAKLRSWELRVVLCKNIWYRSLDIPDITDIINNDPTRSLEKLIQRMGRWARPSPGKDKYRFWDIISSVFHAQEAGSPALRAENSLPKIGKNGKKLGLRSTHQEMSPEFIIALQKRRTESLIWVTSHEIHYRESLRKAYFLWDIWYALEIFLWFATKVFHVHPYQLLRNWELYVSFSEYLEIDFNNERVVLDFKDFSDAIEFYGTKKDVEKYNWTQNISDSKLGHEVSQFDKKILGAIRQSRDTILETLREWAISRGNIEMYTWKTDWRYISRLNLHMQKLGWEILWKERIHAPSRDVPIRFSFDVTLIFHDKEIEYKLWKFAESKKDARHFIAKDIVEKVLKISLQDENDRVETIQQNINSRVELNSLLVKHGWKRAFIQTEKNKEMHIKHVLEVQIGWKTYWYKDDSFFPKTSDAQEHLASLALTELNKIFSAHSWTQGKLEIEDNSWLSWEKKSSISLVYELVQKNKGSIVIEANEVGENEAKVKLFNATVEIRIWTISETFSSVWEYTRKEQARESACELAYNSLKHKFQWIEEYLPTPIKKNFSTYDTLAKIKEKVQKGGSLNADDILKMREVKPWSSKLTHWWMLQFMFRKWLISAPRVRERNNYVVILLNDKNIGSHTKQKITSTTDSKWVSKTAIEKASEVAINNLLDNPEIQHYFIRKLEKQLKNC